MKVAQVGESEAVQSPRKIGERQGPAGDLRIPIGLPGATQTEGRRASRAGQGRRSEEGTTPGVDGCFLFGG